jgi:hypothetical protein
MHTTSRGYLQLAACTALALFGSAALAQTIDTVRYIEARDQAIEESKAPYEAFVARYKEIETTQNMAAAEMYWKTQGARLAGRDHEKLSSLERLLRSAVGSFSHEGFETKGTINLETLSPEPNLGRLDGLEYESRDGRTKILVTTRSLVSDWLGKFYQRPTDAVRHLVEVLSVESQPFLTQAWAIEDQHFTLVDRLPVSKPKGAAMAVAFLGELCAADENYVPDSILAELVVGSRVYLISQSLSVKLPILDECDRQWQKLWDADKPDAAASAFNRCYASRSTSRPGYNDAVAQARRLIDSLSH